MSELLSSQCCICLSFWSHRGFKKEAGKGKIVLNVVKAASAGSKPSAADGSMLRNSTYGRYDVGASAPSLTRVSPMHFSRAGRGSAIFDEAGQTRRDVIDPDRRGIPVLHSIYCSAFRMLTCFRACFYICLHGETWLLTSASRHTSGIKHSRHRDG